MPYKYTKGTCEPGYESVRGMFEQHFLDEISEFSQICVYVKGIKVIDLYGSRPKKKNTNLKLKYDNTSLQNIFSSTKVLTSLVVAMLADRGRLKYQQRVVDIWPEYGQNGKENTTIAEVMRHEAGIPNWKDSIPATKLYAEAIRNGSVSDIVAKQKPIHEPGTAFQYHALTRGWIVNEIVRRVDEKGRTIGQFLHEEVTIPLNLNQELYIGTPPEEHHRIAPLNAELQNDYLFNLKNLALPRFLGGGRVPANTLGLRVILVLGLSIYSLGIDLNNIFSVLRFVGVDIGSRSRQQKDDELLIENEVKSNASDDGKKKPKSKPFQAILVDEEEEEEEDDSSSSGAIHGLFNHAQVRMGETPSANGHASARALAKIAASIVGGGQINSNNYRILSENGCKEAQNDLYERAMIDLPILKFKTNFCNAGWNFFKDTRQNYIGWMGYGGSICQWHAGEEIGIGYTMNLLELSVLNARAQDLQYEVLKCAKRLSGSSGEVNQGSRL